MCLHKTPKNTALQGQTDINTSISNQQFILKFYSQEENSWSIFMQNSVSKIIKGGFIAP